MNNNRRILIMRLPRCLTLLLIVCALAFLVVHNGPVEAFSFNDEQLLTYQRELDIGGTYGAGRGFFSFFQDQQANRVDKVVKFSPSIPVDSKTVAGKESDKCAHEVIEDGFYGKHGDYFLSFLISLVIFLIFVLIGYLCRRFWL